MRLRVGIDVGGTNTDAVLMSDRELVASFKTPTTEDVTSGVVTALGGVLGGAGGLGSGVAAVMIGTTHFTNAVVQRRDLAPTAILRLGLPATQSLPPMVDWPDDLREASGNHSYLAKGGLEFDGRPISPIDPAELRAIARDIAARGLENVAVSAVFSPIKPEAELDAIEILREVLPEARYTASCQIGRTGLLERENAAILNASLRVLGGRIVGAFCQALADFGLQAPLYFTQNDGTLMSAEYVERFPVLTIASGPTNSMRGAAFLSGLKEAIVVDIGGTTSDIGALHYGFPREASVAVEVGGVRTNFRMPDILSIGLGGGSVVSEQPFGIGPRSVGFRLSQEALVFGGRTLTATDLVVAGGLAAVGERERVRHLPADLVEKGLGWIQEHLSASVEKVLLSPEPIPVIVVGGGSILAKDAIAGLPVIRPAHYQVANAVGAAIAQVSGETDRVYALSDLPRERALEEARFLATQAAVDAGADPATVEIVDVEDVPLAYLPGNATRIRVKAVGEVQLA